jgi:hypothetical protein
MKCTEISLNPSLIIFILPVFLLVTCKKDNSENSGNGYRITEAIYSLEGMVVSSTLYEYQGDKMSFSHSFLDSQELYRSEITYPDQNTISMLTSHYHDSTWHESSKMVYKLAGNQVTEIDEYGTDHGTLELSGKETLIYTDGNLVAFVRYSFDSGNWVPVEKTEYFYNGTQFYQSVSYGYSYAEVWIQREKMVIDYQGNHVDTVHYYDYEDGSFIEDYKLVFTYEGDLMMEYRAYSIHYGSWIDDGSVQYTYDSYNNLVSMYSTDADELDKIEYHYEKGNGNYSQLTDYYAYYQYGAIFPHPTMGLHPDFR